ncbi:MAG: hypothetical protein ACPKPY_12595 [Nitrososphaeraceae archaeon]
MSNSLDFIAFANPVEESKQQAIQKFESQFCGLNTETKSTFYVKEIKLENKCEMPVGITIDSNNSVWYLSTKHGSLINYDPKSSNFSSYSVPLWKSRDNPIDHSFVWDLKFDPTGENLWFTDEKQNLIWKYSISENKFEHFKVPDTNSVFGTVYPVSLDFDNNGNIYFVGIRSTDLWIGDISTMKSGTDQGISTISMPVTVFEGLSPNLISTGSLVVDKTNNVVWISMLAFGFKGQILKYDISSQSFEIFELQELPSPVGLAIDEKNNIWISDHGTSIFAQLNSSTGELTKFVTSPVSSRINDGKKFDNAYTLPYWMRSGDNNTALIFNEHTGNKIGKYYPQNMTLVEYWIPSQNKFFGVCSEDSKSDSCGIGNILQISSEVNSSIWFTEWSENKIGMVDTSIPLPFSVSSSINNLKIKAGEAKEIKILLESNSDSKINMFSSASFNPSGSLGNSLGLFNKKSLDLTPGNSEEISYILTISPDVAMGHYILMVGAENEYVSISKAINIEVI